MKTIKLIALFVTGSLTLASCSSDETSLEANQKTSLLKTYKIQRDASGAYSLDLNLSENTKVDNFIDATNSTKQYFLSESESKTKSSLSDNLLIDNTSMRVAFVDAVSGKNEGLYVEDDNITLSAKSNNVRRLKDYSIVSEGEGVYTLDFKVKNGFHVQPEFLYKGIGDFEFLNIPLYLKYDVDANFHILAGPSLNYFFNFFNNNFKVRGDISLAYSITEKLDVNLKYTIGFEEISPNIVFIGLAHKL